MILLTLALIAIVLFGLPTLYFAWRSWEFRKFLAGAFFGGLLLRQALELGERDGLSIWRWKFRHEGQQTRDESGGEIVDGFESHRLEALGKFLAKRDRWTAGRRESSNQ